MNNIFILYFNELKTWLLKLWKEANESVTLNKSGYRYTVIYNSISTLLVFRSFILLIRREIMRKIRSNWVYVLIFGYIRKHIVIIAYACICVIGYIGMYPKGWLQLTTFILLGLVTIWYVQANMTTRNEDMIHMNIILFYLNCGCLVTFFFDYVWELTTPM